MSGDPTLVIRVSLPDNGSHFGRDCTDVARRIVADDHAVLDAQWSYTADKWLGGWPRTRMTEDERAVRDAATTLRSHGCDVPPIIIDELLDIIKRVSK